MKGIVQLLSVISCCANGANILFNAMHSSHSHIGSMLPFAKRLVRSGHNVTFLETSAFNKPYSMAPGINAYFVHAPQTASFNAPFFKKIWTHDYGANIQEYVFRGGANALDSMLDHQHEQLKAIVNESWDLVVADDLFSFSAMGIALRNHRLRGKPFVMMCTTLMHNVFAMELSLSRHPASRPSIWTKNRPEMRFNAANFWDRLQVTVDTVVAAVGIKVIGERFHVRGIRRLGIHDFSYTSLWRSASFALREDINHLAFPQAMGTDVIHTGSHCETAKDVSEEFRSFVEDPKSLGTIVLAFGTMGNWQYAPPAIVDAFFDAFDALPAYRILFSYSGPTLNRSIGSNIKVVRWMPQYDLLAHNKTVLFISHGGLKSVKESLCNGIPMLVWPLFAEQTHNAVMVQKMGFGVGVSKFNASAHVLFTKIAKLLSDSSFRSSANKYRRLLTDRVMNSLDEGAFWIDRLLRTNGRDLFTKRRLTTWSQYLYVPQLFVLIAAFSATVIK